MHDILVWACSKLEAHLLLSNLAEKEGNNNDGKQRDKAKLGATMMINTPKKRLLCA